MPAASAKQYGLMQAIAHGGSRKGGPSKAVAREFIDATPSEERKKFSKTLARKRKKRMRLIG